MSTATEMDRAFNEASDDIQADDLEAFKVVAKWWRDWYMRAGHKRLGRVLLDEGAARGHGGSKEDLGG